MTDLLHIIPDFPVQNYTHLIPSLEKNLITTTDLLTLDATEVSKRAQLPLLDVKRLIALIFNLLHVELGLDGSQPDTLEKGASNNGELSGVQQEKRGALRTSGDILLTQWNTISTLDSELDQCLGGGVPTGYITEFTGESGAGKTQLLLTLLLSGQAPAPHGLSRPTLYLSTEHPLPTTRLNQLLTSHPLLNTLPEPTKPSLARILTLQCHDLESQEHILRYQLPVALRAHNIGLVVIDSIAANFRAESSSSSTSAAIGNDTTLSPSTSNNNYSNSNRNAASTMAARAADLANTGALLRSLAREYDCAVVVANQVADRFAPASLSYAAMGAAVPAGVKNLVSGSQQQQQQQQQMWSSSPIEAAVAASQGGRATLLSTQEPELRLGWAIHPALRLDWQQRWFSGWGYEGGWQFGNGGGGGGGSGWGEEGDNAKTPALGLVWSNQIACRVALVKEIAWGESADFRESMAVGGRGSTEWAPRKWRRWMRVAFAPWVEGSMAGYRGVEYEIWAGGLRSIGVKTKAEEAESNPTAEESNEVGT